MAAFDPKLPLRDVRGWPRGKHGLRSYMGQRLYGLPFQFLVPFSLGELRLFQVEVTL